MKLPAQQVGTVANGKRPPGLKPEIYLSERCGFENPLPRLKSGAGTEKQAPGAKAQHILNQYATTKVVP
jgi:hypothetical protein